MGAVLRRLRQLREIGEAYGSPNDHCGMRASYGGNRNREFGQKGVTNGLVQRKEAGMPGKLIPALT